MSGRYEGQGGEGAVIKVTQLGEGLALRSARKMEFTRDEAFRFLEHKEFVGDRPLKDRHVEYLIKAMKRGTFRPEQVILAICKYDGNVYRMNGQHTAWARIQMPEKYPCMVTLHVYGADSLEDMRTLYSSIDRGSPRTRSNVISSYLEGSDEFEGIKTKTIRIVPMGFGLWFWKTRNERRVYDADDIAFLLKTDHLDLATRVARFLDSHSSRDFSHLHRAPVAAALFATFNKVPQVAPDFWVPVATGTGMDKMGDPRLKLRNELMRVALEFGAGSRGEKKTVSQEFMFRQCLVAWNAWREGRTLQLLKAIEKGNRPAVK